MFPIIQLLISAAALYVTSLLVPGTRVGAMGAILAAIVLAIVNIFIKPILVILTLPINIITLGLFTFVINGLLILLVARVVPDFSVVGFGTAIIFAIVMALVNVVFGMFK
ncbi:MAG: hypothetical protein RL094_686 [Candidatus Parcubacteria bacterium]|jgi:putative membrane protein